MVRRALNILLAALSVVAIPAMVRAQTNLATAQNQYWIPEGTEFKLALHTAINSKTSKKGDVVITTLLDPIYTVDDRVALPKGVRIYGRIQQVHKAHHRGKGGRLFVLFNMLVLPSGQKVAINGSLTEVFSSQEGGNGSTVDAEGDLKGGHASRLKRAVIFAAPTVAGGAAGGMAGGIAAGVAGLAAAYFLPKGKQAVLPAGSLVGMRLDRDLTITLAPQKNKNNNSSQALK